ncbi:MAG TPA: mechanosensitive ion channel [Saprospiraceae bacterium]|nr:mechanosensitive ion channel [Saprospiraceae bacterium]HMP24837.1 mechanosensitive ion channel [Saprospiraceae bacterium]
MKLFTIALRLVALSLLVYSRLHYHEWLAFLNIDTHYLDIIIGFLIFLLATNLLIILLSGLYRRRKGLTKGDADNVIIGLENIYYLLLAGAVITTILGLFGIDLRTLFTSLSIVAAAIAIVSKDYISELISGIIISFSSEVSVGDYIKIGEHKGKIIDLNLTKIVFLDDDDNIIFIPNNKVFISEIVNYTKKQVKRVNIEFEIALQFIKTVEALEADLIESIQDYHTHIKPGSFNLKTGAITKDSVSLKFQYDLLRINRELEQEIRRKTVRRVVNYVKYNYSAANQK